MKKNEEKYPFNVEENITKLGDDYYRILIRRGSGNDIDTFSEYVTGKITDARNCKRKGMGILNERRDLKQRKGKITFYSFCSMWIDYCKKSKLSPTTLQGYKERLNDYVMDKLGNVPLKKIDPFILDELFTNLKNQDKIKPNPDGTVDKLSSNTRNGAYRTLRNVLNKAVLWGYIQYNPLNKIDCPPAKPIREKKSFNKEELYFNLKLLSSYHKKYSAMYILEICTGVRRCELAGIHIDEDIDLNVIGNTKEGKLFKYGLIRVKRSAIFDKELKKMVERSVPKTEEGIREIPIPLFCVEAIEDCLKNRETEVKLLKKKFGDDIRIVNNLFLGKTGGIMHLDTLSHNWTKFKKKYHLKDVSLHGLRHSYCSLQRNENFISDKEVMKIMGHTSLNTTNIYTHANRENVEDILKIWDEFEK